jgi:type I restriction enzyme S subunit
MPFIIPSTIEEQKEIVEYLDKKTTAIDNLMTDITTQIEKLKEYRQAIISEAVTGKVEI